jgi:hypothetical protein
MALLSPLGDFLLQSKNADFCWRPSLAGSAVGHVIVVPPRTNRSGRTTTTVVALLLEFGGLESVAGCLCGSSSKKRPCRSLSLQQSRAGKCSALLDCLFGKETDRPNNVVHDHQYIEYGDMDWRVCRVAQKPKPVRPVRHQSSNHLV